MIAPVEHGSPKRGIAMEVMMPFTNSYNFPFGGDQPTIGGVYGITDHGGDMIFIGQTDNLEEEIKKHKANTGHKIHELGPNKVIFEAIKDEAARSSRAQLLITEFEPKANG
ncbi:MAG: hypothetical protein GEU75_09010 [Dehalococcoidia bacterium]|nr:hypothetical protein [Dehalococcoidia bacterium]